MRANAESFKSWLLADRGQPEMTGLYQKKARASEEQPWYKVMCLTGVDYFSTLGYQPGIAALNQRDNPAELCQLKKFCLSSEQDHVFRQFTAGTHML
jgi:ABC-type molybdate transport system substrate-binding protein